MYAVLKSRSMSISRLICELLVHLPEAGAGIATSR
jgi:hypothetical protein